MQKNIVLIPGWVARSRKLEPLADRLKKLGWNTYIVKLPGFELKPTESVWKLDDYVDYVYKQSKYKFKSKKIFIFGHSFGGRIAIKVAVNYPENLSGVILCATGGISRASLIKRFTFFILAKLGKILLIHPPSAIFWKKLLYKLAREHDYEKAKGKMRETFKKVISENLKNVVGKINLPILVFWGRIDRMTPYKDALYLKNIIKDVKLITFADQGHALPYNKGAELAKEIDAWYKLLN